jgi:acyl dehydratase
MLTEEVRAFVGREQNYKAPEPVDRAAFRYYAHAVGDDNPVYTDDDAALAAGYPAPIAPPTFVVDTNQYASGPRTRDGYFGHWWDLPVEGCRVLRGGHRYEFGRPVVAGDILNMRVRIESIEERQGMLIVTNVIEVTDQHGGLLARNTETLLYQRVPE